MTAATVYLDTDQELYHTSYVYTGLCELASQGVLSLEITRPARSDWRKSPAGSVCVHLDLHSADARTSIPVTIDLWDRSDRFDESGIRNAAVYFKRSFHAPDLRQLPEDVRSKVVPFGANYVCVNTRAALAVTRQIAARLMRGNTAGNGAGASGEAMGLLRKLADFWRYRRTSAYEYPPGRPKQSAILLQTRVWEEHEAVGDDAARLNEERVNLVTALRAEFGRRFRGGLVPSPLAKARYPDLVTYLSPTPRAYARLNRETLVGVYTRGLHDSTAWKFGEYMAASMCLVAEPIRNQLAAPLREGIDLLTFTSVEGCVAGCARVLEDRALQNELRHAAYQYYLAAVEPAAHLRACLKWAEQRLASSA